MSHGNAMFKKKRIQHTKNINPRERDKVELPSSFIKVH